MNVFDIIGPIMIGPSSSHTAGAARIGRVAAILLGEELANAQILLHGSFSKTYKGHGTDKALAGGLIGMDIDDIKIKDSLNIAEQKGIKISFQTGDLGDVHPNTVFIKAVGKSGKIVTITGSSIGGGNIIINKVNETPVEFSGEYNTLVIKHLDAPGVIASVANILVANNVNIANMKDYRSCRGGDAIMVIETDQEISDPTLDLIRNTSMVQNAAAIKMLQAVFK